MPAGQFIVQPEPPQELQVEYPPEQLQGTWSVTYSVLPSQSTRV